MVGCWLTWVENGDLLSLHFSPSSVLTECNYREGRRAAGGKGFILLWPPHNLNQMSLLPMRLGPGAGDNIVVKCNRSESRHVALNSMKQIAPRQTSAAG